MQIKWMVLVFAWCCAFNVEGQEFLQMETKNDPESKKYALGEYLIVKTQSNSEWHKIRLGDFLYEDSIILTDEGFLKISDITHIKDTRPVVYGISKGFQTFGLGYIVYGLLGSLSDNGRRFSTGDAVIGGTALVVGWGFKKAFYERSYAIGSRYRLRLLDLRIRF